jgi:hypothetical protein
VLSCTWTLCSVWCFSQEYAAYWCNLQREYILMHSLKIVYLVGGLHICLWIVSLTSSRPIFVWDSFKKSNNIVIVTHALLLCAYLHGSEFRLLKHHVVAYLPIMKDFNFALPSELQQSNMVDFSRGAQPHEASWWENVNCRSLKLGFSCIQEMPTSNLGWDTESLAWGFTSFPQSLSVNTRLIG